MERRSVIRILLIVFIAAAVGIGFRAVPQAFAQKGACADDVAKFCKDVQPGGGRIIQCLKERENELSEGCKAQQAEMKQRFQQAQEACRDDIARFCSNIQPGGVRIIGCLKEHEPELTPQCKTNLQERHRNRGQ